MSPNADRPTAAELAELLVDIGHRHHHAYLESDGVDPEWALWYAAHLQTRIWDRLGAVPSRSRLVHLLLDAEEQHAASGEGRPWPDFYADVLLQRLSADC